MAIREGFPRCQLTWPDATVGTPPFSMGFNFGESTTNQDLEDVCEAVQIYWNAATTVKGYLTEDLGPITVVADGIYSGVAQTYSTAPGDAPTGSPMDIPGIAVRFRALGSRPVGGRRGSMFLPGLEGAGSDQDGVLNGTYRTELDAWATGLVTEVEGAFTGAFVCTLHTVDSVESFTVVPDFDVAPTVSFLQRRYR